MSSHKRIVQHPRVFLDPGSQTNITTTLTIPYPASTTTTITVDDATNFKSTGFITIDSETIHYTSRTHNSFVGITRGAIATTVTDHVNGSTVTQTRPAINPLVTTDTQLSGWYVDGSTNQASLRVYDAPVIQPGVIRFKADDTTTEPVFQGCYASNTNGIYWANFNALTGPAGTPGDVNTILTFEHVDTDNVYDINNSGEVIKTTTNNTETGDNIKVRRLISGTRTINTIGSNTIAINTTSNDVILNPIPIPYTWDLTGNLSTTGTLKGNPTDSDLLNAYGELARAWVVPGYQVFKGQVVYLTPFISNGNSYLGVQPMMYSELPQLYNYKTNTPSIGLGMLGISRETINATGVTSVDINGLAANIITSGIGIIKISDDVELTSDGNPFRLEADVNYTGRPCLLSKDGFGFNNDQEPSVGSSSYFQVGLFMETGSTVSSNGNYALIKLNPRFI